VIDPSEQHHSAGRAPLNRGCGHCHRLRHGLASRPRNLKPPGQLSHRIGVDERFLHGHSLLARWRPRCVSGDDEKIEEWQSFYNYGRPQSPLRIRPPTNAWEKTSTRTNRNPSTETRAEDGIRTCDPHLGKVVSPI
jgi:hypothetical protein